MEEAMSKISVAFSAKYGAFSQCPLTRALWLALGGAMLAAGAPSFAASATVNWPQTYLTAGHTSFNSTETTLSASNVQNLAFLWGADVAGGVTAFVLDQGVIYAQGQGTGSNNENLVAINATTGETLWSIITGNNGEGLNNTLAAGNGLVFAGCVITPKGEEYAGGICAYEKGLGRLKWSYSNECNCAPPSNVGTPLVYSNGTLYFGYAYGGSGGAEYMVALDAQTGSVLWTYGTGTSNTLGSATPVVGNGKVFFTGGASGQNVIAVNQSNGLLAWTASIGANTSGLTYAPNNVLYVNGGSSGELQALNASTGAQLWSVEYNSSAFPVSVANGLIYATGSDGNVYKFRSANGAQVWSISVGSESSVSLANGVLYEGEQGPNNAAFAAYAMSSGDSLWSSPSPATTLHPPAIIANGVLYITNAQPTSTTSCNVCAYGLPTSE